ncbi:MAG: hypothetical protein GXP04_05505 [Alphaproteobacteria bacterium]|nr:hypothetical protein [Alphaproteobacteria bacterium]
MAPRLLYSTGLGEAVRQIGGMDALVAPRILQSVKLHSAFDPWGARTAYGLHLQSRSPSRAIMRGVRPSAGQI